MDQIPQQKEERLLTAKETIWTQVVVRYISENCSEKGQQKSDNMTKSERKVFKELIINQSSNTDNDKINLNEKNTVATFLLSIGTFLHPAYRGRYHQMYREICDFYASIMPF